MVHREVPTVQIPLAIKVQSEPHVLQEALSESLTMLRSAKKPVILAGVELHRFGLTDIAVKMAERMNIPIAADLLSKSAVPENHPLYIGVYGGAMSSELAARNYFEEADWGLILGTFITDINRGMGTG